MDIESLKFFMTIAEGSTYHDAADKHNISASSLSKAIRRLENELHVELFDRSGRSVKLTPAGKSLYDSLQELAPVYAQMMMNLRKYSNVITCWAMPSASVLRFQYLVEKFAKAHPHIHIDLVSSNNPSSLYEAAEKGNVDLAFVHQSFADPTYYDITFLRDDYLLAVLPPDHPLADAGVIRFADLRNDNIILNKWKIEALNGFFSSLDFTPNIALTASARHSVLDNVASGYGVALFYSSDLSIFKLSDVAVCRIEDTPHNPHVIASPKKVKLTDDHHQFIQYIVNHVASDENSFKYD
ncbi:LysR family transcriptional regulator [Paenibacillus thalictri]|uniref:LysR family transcriptional regulator n=1 Tax=Paenibacillus thalictri TaxID=2527873 RepID=A0A4Q9DP26_9BACL|nr:LysR family transcriptional regulator [Paenibacillus thalictri]TBL76333.1 LysR family transcriptional regulator [Paenibacillus thalictri]